MNLLLTLQSSGRSAITRTLEEINTLKKSIREKESLLARDEEMLPRHSLSVEVLQEALKDYRNQKG